MAASYTAEKTHQTITLGDEIASGGEGRICEVVGAADELAKVFHKPTPGHGAKLQIMLANAPIDPMRAHNHYSIAWPTDRLIDQTGSCVGFLMPKIARALPLSQLYHPGERLKKASGFSWRYLLRAAANLASAIEALHESGYIIGDLNESNILVSDTALVTLVDCDSAQVVSTDGHVYHCTVGKSDYLAPELQSIALRSQRRTVDQDSFALAVLVFMMLMEGVHPFSGVWNGTGEPPNLGESIKNGYFAYNNGSQLSPRPGALPYMTLPMSLRSLMDRTFILGCKQPDKRPSLHEWRSTLSEAERHLTECATNNQHWYGDHLMHCPWCKRTSDGITEPFPALKPERTSGNLLIPSLANVARVGSYSDRMRRRTASSDCVVLAIAGCRRGGKTTTATNLSAYLAKAGHKTLVIDLDPNADATTSFGFEPHECGPDGVFIPSSYPLKVNVSVYDLLIGEQTSPATVVKAHPVVQNLWLLPAKVDLYAADLELLYMGERERQLRRVIDHLRSGYDFILVDCPGYEGGLLTTNALAAADGILMPVQCEYYGVAQMRNFLKIARLIHDWLNGHLFIFGIVLTLFDSRTSLASEIVNEVSQHFPKEKFEAIIPRNVRLAEAPSYGKTILEHDPHSPGAALYKRLAEEVIARAALMEKLNA